MRQTMFISHFTPTISYLDSVKIALAGGCRCIQLRMKDLTNAEVRPVALEAQRLCRQAGATFIIDDRVMLAKELKADGVHLGRNDMPVAEARALLGGGFIIGGTANTFDDVGCLAADGADYIGCGPFRFTTTKKNLSPVLGLEGYRRITAAMRAAGIRLPLIAIGGITRTDIGGILATGVSGIALSGSVLRAGNPVEEMKAITGEVDRYDDHGRSDNNRSDSNS